MNRRVVAVVCALVLGASAVSGCSSQQETQPLTTPRVPEPVPVVIGTLPTEDMLPLWIAEREGLFAEYGLDSVEIVTFEAVQERDAAFAAGDIDAFACDIVAAAQFEAGATPVTIATVLLGAVPAEGRFGVVAAPDSGYTDIIALADVPVATSVNTIEEYVFDGLMRQAGVPAGDVAIEVVATASTRQGLLMQGELKAAVLPEPLLSLAESEGATLLADDTTGENLSQTVLVFSDEYLSEIGGVDTMAALLKVWDAGVEIVNADPDAWRDLLVEQARVPEPIKDTYRINAYPTAQIPTTAQIDAVIDWMREKGTLQREITYEDLVLVTP
ncbi:MAG: ABC transporter substrate-binding protein [Coriobacteriia bacterium]|nr:ABC transporter substrate-binding protein [Coriobacteriia bacterium]